VKQVSSVLEGKARNRVRMEGESIIPKTSTKKGKFIQTLPTIKENKTYYQ
jgi:hypothetical protein